MSKEKREFFLGLDQFEKVIGNLSDSQEKALDLVAFGFSGESKYFPPRETVLLLMETIVAIEEFMEFTTELMSPSRMYEKDNEPGVKLGEAELDTLALQSVSCRDKIADLKGLGIVLDHIQ